MLTINYKKTIKGTANFYIGDELLGSCSKKGKQLQDSFRVPGSLIMSDIIDLTLKINKTTYDSLKIELPNLKIDQGACTDSSPNIDDMMWVRFILPEINKNKKNMTSLFPHRITVKVINKNFNIPKKNTFYFYYKDNGRYKYSKKNLTILDKCTNGKNLIFLITIKEFGIIEHNPGKVDYSPACIY